MTDHDDSSEALRRLAEGDHDPPDHEVAEHASDQEATPDADAPVERPDAPPTMASPPLDAPSQQADVQPEPVASPASQPPPEPEAAATEAADFTAVTAATSSSASSSASPRKQSSKSDKRKRQRAQQQMWLASGVALAGLLFALPAVWGLMFQLGLTEMFASRDKAEQVALAAILLGGAFSLAMFAGGGYLFWRAKSSMP